MDFLDVPVFTHGDPTLWLRWMEDFFVQEHFTDLEKMAFAYGFIDDQAFCWLRWRQSTNPFMCWEEMKIGLQRRFGNPHDTKNITPNTLSDEWTAIGKRLESIIHGLSPPQTGLIQDKESSKMERYETAFVGQTTLKPIQSGHKQETMGTSATHEPLKDAAGGSKLLSPGSDVIVVTSPVHDSHDFLLQRVEMHVGAFVDGLGFNIGSTRALSQIAYDLEGFSICVAVLVKMPDLGEIPTRRPQQEFAKDWQFKYKENGILELLTEHMEFQLEGKLNFRRGVLIEDES